MQKRVLIFFLIFIILILIPIILFPRNTSIEDAQFELAAELFKKNRFEDAIEEFKRLINEIQTKKYRDVCYYYIGNAYFSMEEYGEAERNFNIVVNKYKSGKYHSTSLYLAGRSIFLRNRYSDSIRLFDSYVSKYPSLEYADNSLYWKAEALIKLGNSKKAKALFMEVLKKYPFGDKADAARFKLRVMDLEEKLNTPLYDEGTADQLKMLLTENEQLKVKEVNYMEEINKLNNQIDYLKTEINNLKEVGVGTLAEREKQIQEKINALISWENILKLKENALNQKEEDLDQEYDRIIKIKKELEEGRNG